MRASLLLICCAPLAAAAQVPCLGGGELRLPVCRDLGDLPECALDLVPLDGGEVARFSTSDVTLDAGLDCVPLQPVDLNASGVDLSLRAHRPSPWNPATADGGIEDVVFTLNDLACGKTLLVKQRGGKRGQFTFWPSCGVETRVSAWRVPGRGLVYLQLRYASRGYEGSYVNEWPVGVVPLVKPRACTADGGCALNLPPLATPVTELADFFTWATQQARAAGKEGAAEAYAAEAESLRAYEQRK